MNRLRKRIFNAIKHYGSLTDTERKGDIVTLTFVTTSPILQREQYIDVKIKVSDRVDVTPDTFDLPGCIDYIWYGGSVLSIRLDGRPLGFSKSQEADILDLAKSLIKDDAVCGGTLRPEDD